MQVKVFDLQSNCNVVWEVQSGETAIIDCGNVSEELLSFIKEKNLKIKYFLLTHAHFDHIYGFVELQKHFPEIDVYLNEKDFPRLPENPAFGVELKGTTAPANYDEFIKHIKPLPPKIMLNDKQLHVFASPGHTDGSVLYVNEESKIIISGDTMFEMRTGMSSYVSGNKEKLTDSINRIENAFVGKKYTVYAGHFNTFQLDEKFGLIKANIC